MKHGPVKHGVVIIGAGQAGLSTALALRGGGWQEPITLVGAETHLPYQRPPLSKGMLTGATTGAQLALRSAPALEEQGITLRLGRAAETIDRAARRVIVGREALSYDQLVLATGSVARRLPIPGAALDGVLTLRTRDDAERLRERLSAQTRLVILGGGFIGLEVAAALRPRIAAVTVLEAEARLLARAVSPAMSAAVEARQRALGVALRLGARAAAVEGEARVAAVRLEDGERLPADLVLMAVGVSAATALAMEAGLGDARGIPVDATLRTADPAILAVGDAALHPSVHGAALMRIESVQNAVDQGKHAAATLLGQPAAYGAVPWFWSDQGTDKLQIAGLVPPGSAGVIRGDRTGDGFAVIHRTDDGRVVAVETLNRPADHMLGRRLVDKGVRLADGEAADVDFDLRSALARAA